MKSLLIALCLLSWSADLWSQSAEEVNYFEQHYRLQGQVGKGLVFDILQDQQGWMWLATEYGLIRYGGQEERLYQHDPDNPHSLADNVITCLAEDQVGNLWVGTMNGGIHYFDRRNNQFHRYAYNKNDPHSLAGNKVNKVQVLSDGSVWVSAEGGGVQLFDAEKKQFRRFTQPAVRSLYTDALLEDQAGRLWLGGYFDVSRWSAHDSIFLTMADIPEGGKQVKVLTEDAQGRIWAGCRNGGLMYLDTANCQLAPITTYPIWPDDPRQNNIWDLYSDATAGLWVATDAALFHVRPDSSRTTWRRIEYTLSQHVRYLSICRSQDGVMWIGTNDGAVMLAPHLQPFQYFRPRPRGEAPVVRRGVTTLTQGDPQQIWVATTRGIFQFDLAKRYFHQSFLREHPLLEQFKEANVSALFQDKDQRLWIATIEGFNAGFALFRYNQIERRLLNFSPRHKLLFSFATIHITDDEQGHLWFSNHNGLLRYLPKLDSLRVYQPQQNLPGSLTSNRINQFLSTEDGQAWVASIDAGVDRYDYATDRFYPVQDTTQQSTRIQPLRVTVLYKDAQHQLWLGSDGGLWRLDNQRGSYYRYGRRQGLADPIIKSIQSDGQGLIWVASQTALARLDPASEHLVNFDTLNGVQVEEFWNRVSYQDTAGFLYFGGNLGIVGFHPDSIRANPHLPPIVFTDFLLFNRPVAADSSSRLLPEPMIYSPTLTLRHDQNVFSIRYAALSYISPQKVRYAIRMEGFEEAWQEVGNRTEATYTNLDPGKYFFRVKAANNDGRWNETGATLPLIVLPPWYRTWWAYLLFGFLLTFSLYFLYWIQLKRQLEAAESRRLRELDAIRTQLYTDITHEFRTPLTLIQGPVEQALRRPQVTLGKRELERIRQNCRRLLHLIRQMLHLNKLEAGALQPNYQHGDVLPLIKYIVDAFSSYAHSQQVDLQLQLPETGICMDYDQEKLLDILSNLISNAVKFTPAEGKVRVSAGQVALDGRPHLRIAVQDTGMGILPQELDKIFNRFYQAAQPAPISGVSDEAARSGSGIGLSLTKKLTELLSGQINVKSKVGRGSVFELYLPIQKTAREKIGDQSFKNLYVPQGAVSEQIDNGEGDQLAAAGPRLLIVEDNTEVAQFIGDCLPSYYQKHLAGDGQSGKEWAIEHIPDLIISDIMMPRLDGYTLTDQLKSDRRTSHIPIILLTAKVDLNSKLEGLAKGADAYLAKPFNSRELLSRIENLLASRRRLQTYYRQQSGLEDSEPATEQASVEEHAFLQQIRQLIEAHLEDGDYSIEDLAGDLFMSSSQLYRKMMALIGQSPSKFYRHIQLSRAKQLLLKNPASIADVAYQTGFKDPAYFTRVFTTEIGQSPSAYRQQHR